MSPLRTYRVLPLLVGLALLLGAAAPAVQVVCAMMPGGAQEASMPCHGHEEAGPLLNAQKGSVETPCCVDPFESYHQCSHLDAAPRFSATILSDAAPRVLASATVLPDGALRASVQQSATLYTRAHAPAFTSSSRRQALLATFLI